MKVKEMCDALEKYSPRGLCEGVLIQSNGVPENTEACAVGCFVLAALEHVDWVNKQQEVEVLIKYEIGLLEENLKDLVLEHFELPSYKLDAAMTYSDGCLEYAADSSELPEKLKDTIFRLRVKYVQMHEYQYRPEPMHKISPSGTVPYED